MQRDIQFRIAQGLFGFIAQSDKAGDLVSEVKALKRSMLIWTAASLIFPFSGIAIWQRLGVRHPLITLSSSAAAVVSAQVGHKRRKAIAPKSELLKTEKTAKQERAQQQIINEQFPETVAPPIVSGIGGKVQLALAAQGIKCFVANVVDAPAFDRVKLTLLHGVTVDEVKKYAGKIQSTLKSEIPVGIIDRLSDCDCAVDIAKPQHERRFVKIEKYLKEGFYPVGTPLTWPAGIDANNNLITVKVLDPNYVHPLVGGGTGSGKSVMLLSWIRWLLQWQPADVQIVLVDPKQVTFGQFENLGRINNIAQTMGISSEKAEELFPDKKQADEFADRIAPWLPLGIVTDQKEAIQTYARMNAEMRSRYKEFRKWGVTSIDEYNALMLRMSLPTMPTWIVITDEYYMQVSDKKFKDLTEDELARLGAMARACGIVMVISTQRPSYDILTPKIRDNCMWRICLRVKGLNPASIILGTTDNPEDADITRSLAGKGDMIIEYDNRYERVQSLFWDGETLPPQPTVFPAPLEAMPSPETVKEREKQVAPKKPVAATVAVAEKPETPKVEPVSDAQKQEAMRRIYLEYRKARESRVTVHKFLSETLGQKSYSEEWKRKFYAGLQPFLVEWILELHNQKADDGSALYLPDQIVSIVFGSGFPPRNQELHSEYLAIVESAIKFNSERGDVW